MSDENRIKGIGSILHAQGVAFRVWAPHAQRVSVIGSFNDWDGAKHPMQAEENGFWYANVTAAHAGDQYQFLLSTPVGEFKRIDPYAREVTSSVGNAIVHDPGFDWQGDDFQLAPWSRSSSTSFISAHSAIRTTTHPTSLPRCRHAWDI